MRRKRLRFEFGVELAAQEPGVVAALDDFDQVAVGAKAADHESGFFDLGAVFVVDFEAMAVPFGVFLVLAACSIYDALLPSSGAENRPIVANDP